MSNQLVGTALAWNAMGPLVLAGLLALLGLVAKRDLSDAAERLLAIVMLSSALGALVCFVAAWGGEPRSVNLGVWYEAGSHHVSFLFNVDRLSASFGLLASFLVAIVGFFSASYLAGDASRMRYFVYYSLFASSLTLVAFADEPSILFFGWELLGLSSVLLIGYFYQRAGPVRGAMRALVSYRICDAFLLGGLLIWQGNMDGALFPKWQALYVPDNDVAALTFLVCMFIASLGKSAQLPFSSWLPRAMEGPTPSSAIFYGALSSHAGAFLLLRFSPMLAGSLWLSAFVFLTGLATAGYCAFCGRVRSDVKSQLAFAAAAQVGLIFCEIGLGFYTLALLHLMTHALLRTLQFLRTPSALADFHKFGHSSSVDVGSSTRLADYLPFEVQRWIYLAALREGHLVESLDAWVVRPVRWMAGEAMRLNHRVCGIKAQRFAAGPFVDAGLAQCNAAGSPATLDSTKFGRVQI